jgi:hypothetical protein
MQLNIKDPETFGLAKRIAERKQIPMTQVVRDALRREAAELDRIGNAEVARKIAAANRVIAEVASIAERDGLDLLSNAQYDQEAYDDHGLPR